MGSSVNVAVLHGTFVSDPIILHVKAGGEYLEYARMIQPFHRTRTFYCTEEGTVVDHKNNDEILMPFVPYATRAFPSCQFMKWAIATIPILHVMKVHGDLLGVDA